VTPEERPQPGPQHHRIPWPDFRSLARGAGGESSIRLLLSGERSRRLLMLWALNRELRRRGPLLGPLPPVDKAWDVFANIDAKVPEAMTAVLMSPQFGIWLSRALRLLRGNAASPAPQWAELGYVHAAAFAAAVRAGLDLQTHIPVLNGRAMVPTLGMVNLPAHRAWDVAEAVTSSEEGSSVRLDDMVVKLPSDPALAAPSWWPHRHVTVRAGEFVLRVVLDDLDPYRDLADPVPPARLSDVEASSWSDTIGKAWELLGRICPESAAAMSVGLTSIAPLPADDLNQNRSASTGDGFGAAMITPAADPVTLAVGLVHEFQHIKLGGLLHLVPILHAPANSVLVYAPWRDDPRPLSGLLQGVYAFLGIAGFWQRFRWDADDAEREAAEFEFAYARRQARIGIRSLLGSPFLTHLGRKFINELSAAVNTLQTHRVSTAAARAAWALATDHESTWRIRHIHPDDDAVGRLTGSLLAGAVAATARTITYVVASGGEDHWYHGRLALHRIGLYSPHRLRSIARGSSTMHSGWGVTRADLALATNDTPRAEAGYRAMLTTDPGNIHAWSGLVVAAAANKSTTAWRTLIRRPELVRAVYLKARQRGATISPIGVAEWLDRLPGIRTQPAWS